MFKKFIKKRWLISAILLGFMVLFLALKAVWADFVFVALPFLVLFCIYWVVMLILDFIEEYYTYFDDDFRGYRAEMINLYNITKDEFDANIELYIKKYKKSLRLDKALDIFKILFMISLLAMAIGAFIKF